MTRLIDKKRKYTPVEYEALMKPKPMIKAWCCAALIEA